MVDVLVELLRQDELLHLLVPHHDGRVVRWENVFEAGVGVAPSAEPNALKEGKDCYS